MPEPDLGGEQHREDEDIDADVDANHGHAEDDKAEGQGKREGLTLDVDVANEDCDGAAHHECGKERGLDPAFGNLASTDAALGAKQRHGQNFLRSRMGPIPAGNVVGCGFTRPQTGRWADGTRALAGFNPVSNYK